MLFGYITHRTVPGGAQASGPNAHTYTNSNSSGAATSLLPVAAAHAGLGRRR